MLSFEEVEKAQVMIRDLEHLLKQRTAIAAELSNGESARFAWGNSFFGCVEIVDQDLAASMRALTLGHLNERIDESRAQLAAMGINPESSE